MAGPAAKAHSPEPWRQDHKDRKTILDAQSRMVAVTTMVEDAERLVVGVNATRGLDGGGLAGSPLRAALQVLYEICRYQEDIQFRNHVDRRGGIEDLIARGNAAWRAYGGESFASSGLAAEVPSDKADAKSGTGEAASEGAPAPAADTTAPIRSRRRT